MAAQFRHLATLFCLLFVFLECRALLDGDVLPVFCDFEYNKCFFNQDNNDTFDWKRTKDTGPDIDHTLSTKKGHFYYASASRQHPGDTAAMESQSIPKGIDSYCLSFFIYMYGKQEGAFNVYKRVSGENDSLIYSLIGNQEKHWLPVFIDVPASSDNFRFVLESVVGGGRSSSIGIDDFSVSWGKCNLLKSQKINCNFEGGLCGWSIDSNKNGWTRAKKGKSLKVGPDSDHTLGNGYFMHTKGSYNDVILQSPDLTLTSSDHKCFSFWYNMFGKREGQLEVGYYSNDNDTFHPLFLRSGNQNPLWHHGFIDLNALDETVSVRIVSSGGHGKDSDVAIDDTLLTDGPCVKDDDGAYFSCAFESGMCDFQNLNGSSDFDWKVKTKNRLSITGPRKDHSLKHKGGHFLYASGKYHAGETAKVESKSIKGSTQDLCGKFWYNMNGKEMGTLNVYVESNGKLTKMYSLSGDQGFNWQQASFNFKSQTDFKLVFEAEIALSLESDIAIDDVTITLGECEHEADCDFEKDFCGWKGLGSNNIYWKRTQGETPTDDTGPAFDHTKGNSSDLGYYAFLETTGGKFGSKSYLKSPLLDSTGLQSTCLEFWYSMKGQDMGQLSLNYMVNGRLPAVLIWTARGESSSDWLRARVDLTSLSRFSVEFDGVAGTTDKSDIAIDDIKYYKQACAALP